MLTKDEILEILREFPQTVFHFHLYPSPAAVVPIEEEEEDELGDEYDIYFVEVPATEKPSRRAKLRTSPNPAADGPVIDSGEAVRYLNMERKYGDTMFFLVVYEGVQGWIEEKYLRAK